MNRQRQTAETAPVRQFQFVEEPMPAPATATAKWSEVAAGLVERFPDLARLTPAEQVVADYLRRGLSNREIAAALGKSEATVKHQVGTCLEKFGVRTRGRLIARLHQAS